MVMKTLREMMDLIEAAQRPHESNTKNPVDFPRTWHDVDPKLGKQVDQMSQIEKVKKGFAHPDTLKTQGVAEGVAGDPYAFGDDDYMDIIQGMIDDNRRNMSPSRKPRVLAATKRYIEKNGGVFDPDVFEYAYDQIVEFSRGIDESQGVAEGLPQTLRKVVPGYAKREIDKKMDAGKFGKTDADKDANFHRYKKIQDKIKGQGVAEGIRDDAMAGLQKTIDFAKQHGYKIYRSPTGRKMRFVNPQLNHEIRAQVDNDGDSINVNFVDYTSGTSGNDDASYFDQTFKKAYEQALKDHQSQSALDDEDDGPYTLSQLRMLKKQGVAEEQVEESSPEALDKIDKLFRK